MSWYVYIVSCADKSLYTGITSEVGRRVAEHNRADRRGSKYTRGRLPVILVYTESAVSRAAASKRELQIKALSRQEKLRLIKSIE